MPKAMLCLIFGLLAAGCPESGKPRSAEPKRCERFGDTCDFAPGKLGACVQKDDCTGSNCLVCQSQH
jgi:hypothetical protein